MLDHLLYYVAVNLEVANIFSVWHARQMCVLFYQREQISIPLYKTQYLQLFILLYFIFCYDLYQSVMSSESEMN